ncbi:MAG: hypothetical protein MR563_04490 [Spirochaetales bacterium]|nr:hypothetical protein [Spirochaetales bacterium]
MLCYTPETDGDLITGFTPETAESIQKIMASVNKIAQGEDSQKLLIDVLTNVLSKGVTLRLPGNGSDTISIVSTGNYTPGKLTVNVNANVFNYQLGDSGVSADGTFIASVDIDIAKMNSHNPADYPYVPTFKIDPESTLTLTVKEKEYRLNSIASIEAFQKEINANNGENELSKKLLDALKNSYKQICVDVLKIAKEFLADDGYRIETDQYLISLKGTLDWRLVSDTEKDKLYLPNQKISNIYEFFGSIFDIISVRNLTLEVSTKDVITLDDAGFEVKLVGKVSNAYLSFVKTIYNETETWTPTNILAVCNSADVSLAILTHGNNIGENTIYVVGHFEGRKGLKYPLKDNKTAYGYIRFNGEDYKVEDFFNNIGKMMSQAPVK